MKALIIKEVYRTMINLNNSAEYGCYADSGFIPANLKHRYTNIVMGSSTHTAVTVDKM